jgi:hypothetical protein
MLKLFPKYAFILFTLIIFSCSNSGGENEKVSFEVIHEGSYSAISDKRELIIYNESQYKELMNDVYKNLDQMPKITAIDFKKNSLVAVFIGSRSSGGYQVKIDSIIETSNNLAVNITETTPGKNCMVTDGITSPFVILRITKTEKKAEFKTKKIEKDCQ